MILTDANFEQCSKAADLLERKLDAEAREEIIKILAEIPKDEEYGELLNSLIRRCGLLPYMQLKTASWADRVVFEAFKVDSGNDEPVTLHREQSFILKKLLNGESLAISAPTSFGKSFIVDAFIAIKKPSKVVVIVPTIALSDEIRRRVQRKFGATYKIITTAGVELTDKSILVCPAERIAGYLDALNNIDLLIVDEFYKADSNLDKDRSPALLRAILRLSPRSKQRYYLAPHIESVEENAFTQGMEFLALDFKTVLLKVENLYEQIGGDSSKKEKALLRILNATTEHSLIYAGSIPSVGAVGNVLLEGYRTEESTLLNRFATWLELHYGDDWDLPKLIRLKTGVHTGKLHRFLGQIQIYLFEQEDGLRNIISTSSIVEGVNTQAKNVIVWKSKNGQQNLSDFTYRNIIGRGGRAFRHFVGNVYLLDRPPPKKDTLLQLEFSDDVLSNEPDILEPSRHITPEQVTRIANYKAEMRRLLGAASYDDAIKEGKFFSTDAELLKRIAQSVRNREWAGIGFLNGPNLDTWDRFLYKAMRLENRAWEEKYSVIVNFVKALSYNWVRTIPELIALQGRRVTVNMFFSLERTVSFKLHSILADVNSMNILVNEDAVDISPFLSRLSSAFLPRFVYDLEEYGLPRMIARKLSEAGLVDFESTEFSFHQLLENLNQLGIDGLRQATPNLSTFDLYLLKYFLDGIKHRPTILTDNSL